MPWIKYPLYYLINLVVFLIFDFLWLGFIAKDLYQKQIGFLLKANINWLAAIIFYLLFVFGLLIFALLPALKQNSLLQAILLAGLFGFIAYATYDLTNLATIKNWPLLVTIVDLIWGFSIAAISTGISFFIIQKFLK